MEPDDFLCSRNARPQKDGNGSLVVLLLAEKGEGRLCAQWEINQATLWDIEEYLWKTWMIKMRRGENRG